MSDKNNIYFYYYNYRKNKNKFELARTNCMKEMGNCSHTDIVFDTDVFGSSGFATNRLQNQFIFQGGYNDYSNFYL